MKETIRQLSEDNRFFITHIAISGISIFYNQILFFILL